MYGKFFAVTLAGASLLVSGAFSSTHAEFIANIQQVGSDVVVTGSGTLDLTGLTLVGTNPSGLTVMDPSAAALLIGPRSGAEVTEYRGITGPSTFGSGSFQTPTSGTGDVVGIGGSVGTLFVPEGYTSGSALSDSMSFDNTTLASFGLTAGSYTWSWDQAPDDSFVINVIAPTPLSGALPLFAGGLGMVGFLARRKKQKALAAA